MLRGCGKIRTVNIVPNRLQLNPRIRVPIDDVLHNRPILVAPATLMVAESPIHLQSRSSYNTAMILSDYVFGGRSAKEIEVEAPSYRPVRDIDISQKPFLAVCIVRIDSMGERR